MRQSTAGWGTAASAGRPPVLGQSLRTAGGAARAADVIQGFVGRSPKVRPRLYRRPGPGAIVHKLLDVVLACSIAVS